MKNGLAFAVITQDPTCRWTMIISSMTDIPSELTNELAEIGWRFDWMTDGSRGTAQFKFSPFINGRGPEETRGFFARLSDLLARWEIPANNPLDAGGRSLR